MNIDQIDEVLPDSEVERIVVVAGFIKEMLVATEVYSLVCRQTENNGLIEMTYA
jgi:hypothetical protein